jgi:serine/threonine protein kinase
MAGSVAAGMSFTPAQWREALAEPTALADPAAGQVVKQSASGTILRRRLRVGEADLDVYIKHPRRKHKWKVIIDCFRRSRLKRSFHRGHEMLTRRVPTALPLAVLERRRGPLLLDSMLIVETVDAPRLDHFLSTHLATPPRGEVEMLPAQQRRLTQAVLWQMGRMLQRLHDRRYAHRDLKSSNMLVRWRPGVEPEIVLIDLDGLRPVWRVTARRRFQGLMRLNVSLLRCGPVTHAGRLRMLLGYLRRPGCGRINFKPYWRVLERWSARKLRQQIVKRQQHQRSQRRPG